MPSKRGFTLIELLVVVAIIVALLAILLPSMSRAIENARRAVCCSNQHQLYISTMNYAGDNFTMFPSRNWESSRYAGAFQDDGIDEESPNHWGRKWTAYIAEFVFDSYEVSPPIVYCPSIDNQGKTWRPAFRTRWRHGDYAYWPTMDLPCPRAGNTLWAGGEPAARNTREANADEPIWGDPVYQYQLGQESWYASSHPRKGGDGYNGHADNTVRAPEPEGANQANGDGSVRWLALREMNHAIHMFNWGADGGIAYQWWYRPR